MFKYFIIYKPYGVLSQFTPEPGSPSKTLRDVFTDLPQDVYAVGRLDADSEGLLLLTNNPAINHQLLHPDYHINKTYWVQVAGLITQAALQALSEGVSIKINQKDYYTRPCSATFLTPIDLRERNPPIRTRTTIPTSWLVITLQEGKNRQVRKMLAKVGFPVLRLIRYSIENLCISDLKSHYLKQISE